MNDIPMSSLSFKFMGLFFRFRDLLTSPTKFLEQTDIGPGWNVLDFWMLVKPVRLEAINAQNEQLGYDLRITL